MTVDAARTVVLCHPACVGGSLIYRYLVSSLGMAGVSEVGVGQLPYEAFRPLEPLYQWFLGGVIGRDDLESDFLDRVRRAREIVDRQGKPFLIREHSHGLFFPDEPDAKAEPRNDPSWLAPRLEAEGLATVPRIFSYRHPLNSWLSLRSSFPIHAQGGFRRYCHQYLAMLDSVDAAESAGRPIYRLSYEDFLAATGAQLERMGQFLNLPVKQADAESAAATFSTGNSGRAATNVISPQPARPAPPDLLDEAAGSGAYGELVQRLGYPRMPDDISVERPSLYQRVGRFWRRRRNSSA